MSYLKIFPHSIIARRSEEYVYEGCICYDFEMYGQMYYGNNAEVSIVRNSLVEDRWFIRSAETEQTPTGYKEFIQTLNYYLFEYLLFNPITHWYKPSMSQYEYHFESVYFDLGFGKIFNKIKI